MGLNLSSTSSKVLASAALLAAAAGVAGLGTYGGFSGTTEASTEVASGTVILSGAESSAITVAATNVIPGDTMQRPVTLSNTGTVDFSSTTLTTTSVGTDATLTSGANPLRMSIDSCSTAWTETGTTKTYTCAGTTTPVLAEGQALITNGSLGAIPAGQAKHLRATLTLPLAAGNEYQAKTSSLKFEFGGAVSHGSK